MGVRRCPSIGQGAWSGPAVFHTPTLIVLFYTHKHNASFRLPTPKPVMRLQTQESITISDHEQSRLAVFSGNRFMISGHSCPKQLLAAALLDRGRSPAAWLWRPETLPQGP